jgi:hypothetical protein
LVALRWRGGGLAGTIFARTHAADTTLRDQVVSIWGSPHEQKPPEANFFRLRSRKVESVEDGKKVVRTVEEKEAIPLNLEGNQIAVNLDLEHRRKGLLWYSTYKVVFSGDYTFRNPSEREEEITFAVGLPAAKAIYDDFVFAVNNVPLETSSHKGSLNGTARVPGRGTAVLRLAYRSQGLDSWRYHLGGEVAHVRNFDLKMSTNFKDINFPVDTLAATEKKETADGWELVWMYKNLVSGFQIGMEMPGKLQPGPVAGRISAFAPVSLFFFFFILFMICTLRDIDLHPMNYFFLAAAFFSFHLLLAYLVDHISLLTAFGICSVVSLFLVVSYLRLVVGLRFAAIEAGSAHLVYLILFSSAFFFEGYTGLTVTLGAIVTLFVVMQLTGRIRWSEKFGGRPTALAPRPPENIES